MSLISKLSAGLIRLKRSHVDGERSDMSTAAHIKKRTGFESSFLLPKIDIGFQDSCDWNFVVSMPMFRAVEADL